MVKVWVGLVVLTGLGCSSSGSTGSHSSGASSAAGASNGAMAGAAGGGGASTGGSTTGAGAGAGPGGGASTAGSPAMPWPTDAAVAPDPKTKGGACFLYAYDHCVRFTQCSAYPHGDCLDAGEACPDLAFSEGSTRTVENVVACARAWRAFSCEELLQGAAPECATMGTKLVGEECAYSSQCSTLACDAAGSCGKCVEVVGLDQDCSGGKGCTGSAICTDAAASSCRPSSLVFPTVGGTCNAGQCRQGSYCDKEHVCVANPAPAQACGDGVFCNFPRDYCRQDTTCQPAPGAGQPCGLGVSPGSRPCAEGNSCVDEMCVAFPKDGEPCAFGNHCAPGFACDSVVIEVTGTCHPGAKGDPCTPGTLNCDDGLSCDGGVCKNTVGPEMPCSDGSTLCALGKCDGGVCVPPDDQRRFSMECGL